jgi:O6-methylguanine-DNA--protein-cysteine methyltransferase
MPSDSFERFLALPAGQRSYAELARRLGVSKRSVVARAAKEKWQERLLSVEAEARAKADQKLAETTAAINDRHLRTLRAVQHKALQALTSAPMGTAAQAAATLIAALRAERGVMLAPGDGTPAGDSALEFASRVRAFLSAARATVSGPPPAPETNGHGALPPGEN